MSDPNIIELLRENQRLLTENNTLLRKMHRSAVIGFWFKIVWIAVLIGAPFILYVYVLKPYLEVLPGASYFDSFEAALEQLDAFAEQANQPR